MTTSTRTINAAGVYLGVVIEDTWPSIADQLSAAARRRMWPSLGARYVTSLYVEDDCCVVRLESNSLAGIRRQIRRCCT
jgi:hypothetical protein